MISFTLPEPLSLQPCCVGGLGLRDDGLRERLWGSHLELQYRRGQEEEDLPREESGEASIYTCHRPLQLLDYHAGYCFKNSKILFQERLEKVSEFVEQLQSPPNRIDQRRRLLRFHDLDQPSPATGAGSTTATATNRRMAAEKVNNIQSSKSKW